MKFKVRLNTTNKSLMTGIVILLIFSCILWYILQEYTYFIVYTLLTIIIIHMYYFQSYYLEDKYLKVKLGFLTIKIKYQNITNVEIINNNLNIKFKKINIVLYPLEKEKFKKMLKEKIEVK